MFEEAEVDVNNIALDNSMRNYQLEVYKNLLFYADSSEKSFTLQSALWSPDVGTANRNSLSIKY